MNLVTGVAGLEMVESYITNTAFTTNLGTGFDGSTFARAQGKFPKKKGDDFAGYTRYVKINFGLGLGPGIVEGKFQPNIVTLFDVTGEGNWVPMEFMVGKKEMRLVYLDKAFEAISHKYNSEQVRRLASLYADWQYPIRQKEVRRLLKEEFDITSARFTAYFWILNFFSLVFNIDKQFSWI